MADTDLPRDPRTDKPWQPSDAGTETLKGGTLLRLSCYPGSFQRHFNSARMAIENGDLDGLKEAVAGMKGTDQCLDVCDTVSTDSGANYSMCLLAYAGYHAQKDILQFLIQKDADFDMGNTDSGSPLIQMMVYACIKQTEESLPSPILDVSVVKLFTANGTVLSRVIYAKGYDNCTALVLAICFQRFDIIQVLIEAGADPILCGDGNVSPLLVEYPLFGTHNFVRWMFSKYLSPSHIQAFINRLLETGVLFNDKMRHAMGFVYGKNPVHAFLLCGHKQAIKYLVYKKPELLKECNPSNSTALHLAAEEGDLTSVKILLDCKAPVDKKDVNSRTPLKMAVKNNRIEVVRLIESRTKPGPDYNPMELWEYALQYGYDSYFEAMHRTSDLEKVLMSPIENNSDENTIAHIAAERGVVSVFKTTFPKTQTSEDLYEPLKRENKHHKTPLQLAIENGHIRILTALQERIKDREKAAVGSMFNSQAVSVEEPEWDQFWEQESPKLLLYACQHGTVDMVDYFITREVSATTRIGHQTPLSCAAEGGKHEIVEYLLKRGVPSTGCSNGQDTPAEYHPLMLAAKFGYAKCVILLLKGGANSSLIHSNRKYNCLMEAISAGHKETAEALLRHDTRWKAAMGHKKAGVSPLKMLIKEMPGVAKIALSKYITKGTNTMGFECDFDCLEQYKSAGGNENPVQPVAVRNCSTQSLKRKRIDLLNSPLATMVQHKRLELLQHPLVSQYISLQWCRLFPIFIAYILFYIFFLCLLTAYVIKTPRPGPDNQYCPSKNFSENSTGISCMDIGVSEGDLRLYRALAVLIILLCISFLILQVIPVGIILFVKHARDTVAAVIVSFIRFLTFVLTIIFVSGFGNECWCSPSWQWQIGALAVFMAYLFFILLLAGIPLFGVNIYMLVNIVVVFLKLVYLPILLVLSFAFPFYMLFVRESGAMEIETFSSPELAIFKVIFQTVGQLDFTSLFENGDLLYAPMVHILFILFTILVPLLFITMLIGLAVGTTEKDIENAMFGKIELQVEYILTGKLFEPLTKCLWGLPKNSMMYVATESKDTFTRLSYMGLNKLRGVDSVVLAKSQEDMDQTYRVVKENVKSVLGLENSLLDYTDRSLQNLLSEMKNMRETLDQLQKREKILHSDIRSIKAKLEGSSG